MLLFDQFKIIFFLIFHHIENSSWLIFLICFPMYTFLYLYYIHFLLIMKIILHLTYKLDNVRVILSSINLSNFFLFALTVSNFCLYDFSCSSISFFFIYSSSFNFLPNSSNLSNCLFLSSIYFKLNYFSLFLISLNFFLATSNFFFFIYNFSTFIFSFN